MPAPSTHSSLAQSYDERTSTYQTFGNNALLQVVRRVLPREGAVLDVGCASGGLLAGLRDVAARRVGVEISSSAAAAAAAEADKVVVGDIADPALSLDGEQFDVVVLADVVEHTVDPHKTLELVRRHCKPTGRIVVSVPNVAHWAMRWQLARGRWDYTESGVLDRSHLRFFTRTSVVDAIVDAGYAVEDVTVIVPRLRNHVALLRRAPKRLDATVERWWQRLGRRRPGLFGYQLLVVAGVAAAQPEPRRAP